MSPLAILSSMVLRDTLRIFAASGRVSNGCIAAIIHSWAFDRKERSSEWPPLPGLGHSKRRSIHNAQISFRATLTNLRVMHPSKGIEYLACFAASEKSFAYQGLFHQGIDLLRARSFLNRSKIYPLARWRVRSIPGNGFDFQAVARRRDPDELPFDFLVCHFRFRLGWMISTIA